jgi:GTP-binding protein Era
MDNIEQKCGFTALIGPPNAGKSTLSNFLVGEKVSIISSKVQTTRNTIKAIFVEGNTQIIFLDTPGIFIPRKNKILERTIVKSAWQGIKDADNVCLLIDATKGCDNHIKSIIADLRKNEIDPVIVINKVDLIKKVRLLEMTAQLLKEVKSNSKQIFMISADSGEGVKELKEHLISITKKSPWVFSGEEITDAPVKYLASEITREKLFLNLHEDLPYAVHIENDSWQNLDNGDVKIYQTINVLRESQKAIVIGNRGSMIKEIGELARADMAKMLGVKKVHLFLVVKVKNWMNTDFINNQFS